MNKSQYNPEIHHRKSIRLKGHDYAGGGLYFVTICAHRNAGNIFATENAKEMVAHVWEAVGAGLVSAQKSPKGDIPESPEGDIQKSPEGDIQKSPKGNKGRHKANKGRHKANKGRHKACPYVIMPDHFHALIRIPALQDPPQSLGDIICEFKSRVVHEYIAGVKSGKWPRFEKKIWHRNYYEMIVRTPEAEKNITNYIKMNPWKCVTDLGSGLRGMGNPTLWNATKRGILCSRNGAPTREELAKTIPDADAYLGGFHSPPEQAILQELLKRKANIIYCPAWGLKAAIIPMMLEALAENRMLMLEMKNLDGNLAAAKERNEFIIQRSDHLWLPHITPGGMLDRQTREFRMENRELRI